MCLYLTKAKINRTKKTILGLVLVLSFPQIPQLYVANLIGISATTIRSSLKVKNLTIGNIAKHIDLVIKEQVDLESMLDYLEIIVTSIKEGKTQLIKPTTLAKVLDKAQQIKANVRGITRKLGEKGVYRDEGVILATAIYISCPSLNRNTIKHLIMGYVHRRLTDIAIKGLQKEFSAQKSRFNNQFSLVELLGDMIEERETDVLCANCGKFVHLQVYQDSKKIFACKHCSF